MLVSLKSSRMSSHFKLLTTKNHHPRHCCSSPAPPPRLFLLMLLCWSCRIANMNIANPNSISTRNMCCVILLRSKDADHTNCLLVSVLSNQKEQIGGKQLLKFNFFTLYLRAHVSLIVARNQKPRKNAKKSKHHHQIGWPR